jgi:phage replication initiation protein
MSFTLTLDYFRFTLPNATAEDVTTRVRADWTESDGGFRGYPKMQVAPVANGGLGRIGYGKPKRPHEVHVDLTGGFLAGWTYEELRSLASWVVDEKGGHVGRLDNAFDDRQGLVSIADIAQAVKTGQAVMRAKQWRQIEGGNVDTQTSTGATFELGSRESQTFIRIYDKALEQAGKGVEVVGPWVRWELELKEERAQVCAMALIALTEAQYRQFLIGVLINAVDFRDCTSDDDPIVRLRATRLPWWITLTDGLARAQLNMERPERKIEDVKAWIATSLGPMLALANEHPEAGPEWLQSVIRTGKNRWGERHHALYRQRTTRKPYVLRPPKE